MRPAPVLSALLLATTLARSAAAQTADDTARARELFLEGSARAMAGDWEAARDRFERSAKLKRAALTLYNLGIAQEETGHVVDAMESFHAFLAQPVDAATQRYVEPVRADLVKLEARAARVEIDVQPPGVARVLLRVDGRDVTPARGPHLLDPGVHDIAVIAPGLGEAHEKASLPEGARATLVLDLFPRARPTVGLALPIGLTVAGVSVFAGGAAVFGIGAAQALSTHPQAGSTRTMIGGATAMGVGGLVLGAGIALLIARSPRWQTARVTPWIAPSAAGVRGRF